MAAYALSKMGVHTKKAVTLLIQVFENNKEDKEVRSLVARALGKSGPVAEIAIPSLVKVLMSARTHWLVLEQHNISYAAQEALAGIGSATVPALSEVLKKGNSDARYLAAKALEEIGVDAKLAVPTLIELLKDKQKDFRQPAAQVLGKIGSSAVPALTQALQDKNNAVRLWATYALGEMNSQAKAAVPNLIKIFENENEDKEIRLRAAYALGKIGSQAKKALPTLTKALKVKDNAIQQSAATAIGEIGLEARTAIPALTEALKNWEVASYAALAIRNIGENIQDNANWLSTWDLDKAISDLEKALQILEKPDFVLLDNQNSSREELIGAVRRTIDALKAKKQARIADRVIEQIFIWIGENRLVAAVIIYLIFFPSLWSVILRLRPLLILQINNALKPIEIPISAFNGNFKIPVRHLVFVKLFIYHPRVLDAWVSTHIETVREQFTKRETVEIRATYIPVSFELDNKKVTELRCQELRSTFTKNRIRLLIWGEGGIGKTSIACQIADWAMESDQNKRLCKHLMIPILIEEELKNVNEGKDSFLTAINGQLKSIADLPKPADEELLKQLLQQRRLLVIVDHFSEMSETTQKAILPNSPDFPVNALVVTSRLDSSLGRGNKTTLHPLRIEGSELSNFMQKYLEKLGKGDIYNGSQFHYACGDLAKLLEGISSQERSTTVLFAKLYADLLIAKKENNPSEKLPQNIPDLMLSYLNEINRDVAEDKLSDNEVHEIAKMLAWECLKVTYRPTSIKIKDALTALSALNLQDTEERLKYLEEKLRIIQRKGSSKDNISFVLDPVAEYLAGLHLVDTYGTDDSKWCDFIINGDFQTSLEAIKGFMLAVRDCYLAKVPDAKSTDYLPTEIATRYNISITVPSQIPQLVSP